MTTRGIPMIYYGDEIGMAGGNDPDNRRDFPRGPFTPEQQTVLNHVRKLAHLRAVNPELRRGKMSVLGVTDHLYAYSRGNAIVLLNNGPSEEKIEFAVKAGTWRDELGGLGEIRSDGVLRATVPARSGAVLLPLSVH